MVGVKGGKVVATHGDTLAEVNRGLNCIKGYFLSKIMYGGDRLTTPLLRKRNGVYDKNGELTPVGWDEAFDVMAARAKAVLKEKGPTALGMFGSGQWTVFEGYAATKLMRAGFRSNNLDPNARHCMASAAMAFMRTFGMDEPMGCYDDFEAADAFVLWGSNMAEMHPILWTRSDRSPAQPSACESRGAVHIHQPQFGPCRHSHRLQAGDRSGDPELHRQSHHLDRTGQPGVRQEPYRLRQGGDRYRLRTETRSSARGQSKGCGQSRRDAADRFRCLCKLRERLHAREGFRTDRG